MQQWSWLPISVVAGVAATLATPYLMRLLGSLFRGVSGPRKANQVYGLSHRLLNLQVDRIDTWLNMGLWTDGIVAFPAACRNLAQTVVAGCIEPGNRIVDFGCGCGDQLLLWATLQPNLHSVAAVTAEPAQARIAQLRVLRANLAQKIHVHSGDALDPTTWQPLYPEPVADILLNSIDTVISIDACYHFDTRVQFFDLAHTILKPRGRLCVSDILLGPNFEATGDASAIDWFWLRLFCSMSGVPLVNLCSLEKYRASLLDTGFTDIKIQDVTSDVFPGLRDFTARQGKDLDGLVDPWVWMQYGWGMSQFLDWFHTKKVLRFVIVRAMKPDE
ncbi:S-adenosyl-L-methionine-dependent methyltransferase [Chytriomyces sp. MP71]|nr:S-adenosyl-L-methionine-dependent methyltransferase [Chytriomyces sp. MP71]